MYEISSYKELEPNHWDCVSDDGYKMEELYKFVLIAKFEWQQGKVSFYFHPSGSPCVEVPVSGAKNVHTFKEDKYSVKVFVRYGEKSFERVFLFDDYPEAIQFYTMQRNVLSPRELLWQFIASNAGG